MEHEVKWVQINAQVPLSQRERLKENARKCEMSVSQLINEMITSTQIDISPGMPAQMRDLNSWLGRINSNINMLAHHANTYREKADADLIIYQLNFIARDINEVVIFSDEIRKSNRTQRVKKATAS
ncbi:hypothetical protein ATI02_4731 [Pseudomonas baetica]|uniref:Plasmid mobilization relaxosome protein MobC n=1 Tax=Pseudomonas baetica TaxID=674054 RepID=A0ABX4Q4M2_9PSED|nr:MULTISPECIES: hypothetical protein [Pseudomonas]MBV4509535.1 hypothetical protein [Pseudomonas sp. SWRI22]MDA7013306.1 hypothetical protein [Pseudomonas cerasi]PKA71730.1 hypothetical protein ATI02_4731 [Pseudomonas baetica]PTC20204.1 hypothetical protein C0J26_09555 [Pseudomonas baetica]